jgi:uncharacterized protein
LLYNIGLAHLTGTEIPQSTNEALSLFRMAAERGVPEAKGMLARLYFQGVDVNFTREDALNNMKDAANAGHAESAYNLGVFAYQDEDYNLALKYFQMAANARYIDAYYNLGIMYENGEGCSQSLESAIKWYEIASKYGDKESQKALDRLGKPYNMPWLKRIFH